MASTARRRGLTTGRFLTDRKRGSGRSCSHSFVPPAFTSPLLLWTSTHRFSFCRSSPHFQPPLLCSPPFFSPLLCRSLLPFSLLCSPFPTLLFSSLLYSPLLSSSLLCSPFSPPLLICQSYSAGPDGAKRETSRRRRNCSSVM